MLKHVVLAQGMSLAVTITGAVSAALAGAGASIPFFQTWLTYLFLSATCLPLVHRTGWKQSQWKYLLLAGFDVCSTWCIVKAFKSTSITSVSLLDAWTVPCVMLLTATLLRTRYSMRQVLSALLAIAGLVVLLLFDRKPRDSAAGSNPALGDLLTLLGSTGYAANNVLGEHLLQHVSSLELLAGLGLYGFLLSSGFTLLFEASALRAIDWDVNIVLLLAAYVAVIYCVYFGVPLVLKLRGSAFLSLSMLTSDLYSAVARVVFFSSFTRQSAISFGISCTLIVTGLVAYFTAPATKSDAADGAAECHTRNEDVFVFPHGLIAAEGSQLGARHSEREKLLARGQAQSEERHNSGTSSDLNAPGAGPLESPPVVSENHEPTHGFGAAQATDVQRKAGSMQQPEDGVAGSSAGTVASLELEMPRTHSG